MKDAAECLSETSGFADLSLSRDQNARLRDLLLTLGMEHWAPSPLTADASQRRYVRMTHGTQSAMLMIAPPPLENAAQFCRVAEHLRACDLRAPRILAADEAHGFVVIEDFGDDTLSRLLDSGADPAPLYGMVIDALAALHQHPSATRAPLSTYHRDQMIEEMALFAAWFVPEVAGRRPDRNAPDALRAAWRDVLTGLPAARPTLILGDYHVDNIMQVGAGHSVVNCGLLDFQDASIGPQAFDVMSLLEDARRDVDPALSRCLLSRYRQAMGQAVDPNFDLWFDVLAAHRHMRILGVFVRLARRDAKPAYLRHVWRVARQLNSHRGCPELAPIYAWLDAHCRDFLAVAQRISATGTLPSGDRLSSVVSVFDRRSS